MKLSQVLTITAGTALAAGVGYAIYFDYKRQNDPAFRKQLKKQDKKTKKAEKKQQEAERKQVEGAIEDVVKEIRKPGSMPTNPQDMEKFFMETITQAETLVRAGPSQYLTAAVLFFKAIKVYPQPMELLEIIAKATPDPCLNLILAMVQKDAELEKASPRRGMDPFAQLAQLASQAPGAQGQQNLSEVDDDVPQAARGPAAASQDTEADTEAAAPASSGPPSQASSQEWDKLSGTSLGESAASQSTTTATPPTHIDTSSAGASQSTTTTEEGQKAFDFSSSGSFAPSPLFEKSQPQAQPEQAANPLGAVEAAAAGEGESEQAATTEAPSAEVPSDEKAKQDVQSESGV